MIRRTMDAAFLTEVANDPQVRPFLGGDGPLDIGQVARDPANVLLVATGRDGEPVGGWVLHPILPAVYELHTMFLPAGRGKLFFAAAAEMFRFMFAETDALEIVTKCPDDNPGARMAASTVGFRERFRREGAWAPGVGVSYRVFSVDDWFIRDPECLAQGRAFHDALEAAKAGTGDPLLFNHTEDEAHDRAVGAAALMVRGGNTAKGVAFYNRWAALSGYAQVHAVSNAMIDVLEAIVWVRPDGFDVMLVRGVS